MNRCLFAIMMSLGLASAFAEPAHYHTNKEMAETLKSAASADKKLFEVTTLAEDARGRAIPIFRAGADDPSNPAILVIGGLDGRHLIGTEMAIGYVNSLAADPEAARKRYSDRTLYVIPRVNLEGADSFFAKPLVEQAGLSVVRDADKDSLVGEDLADDLNSDGVLTAVRVKDVKGTMVLDGDGKDFLREAKRDKGERGEWLFLTEGRDDDGDEVWNEEQDAGTNLARNFTHQYEWYARDTGVHQISEPLSRAVADFLIQHPNIGTIVIFGFEDNLMSPPAAEKAIELKFGDHDFDRKPVSAMEVGDLAYLAEFAKQYREDMALSDAVKTAGKESASKGGFGAFAHFARGRFTMMTPVWAPPVQLAWNKSAKGAGREEKKGEAELEDAKEAGDEPTGENGHSPKDGGKKDDIDPAVKKDQEFRDWLVKENPEAWIPWKKIDHPDFKGQEAEAGGFAPFAKINPPPAMIADLSSTHTLLVNRAADMLPRVKIRSLEAKELGGGIAEVTVIVENTGGMPDVLAMGRYSTYVHATRVEFDAGEDGEVLGDTPVARLEPLAGNGGFQELRRLVRVDGKSREVTVRVFSDCAGTDESTVALDK